MKKILLITALTALLFSCKKADLLQPPTTVPPEQAFVDSVQDANRGQQLHITTTTEPYISTIFDTCRKEVVDLNGTVTYTTITSGDPTDTTQDFFMVSLIDLTKVKGIGEITDTHYSGGGQIKSMTWINKDHTDEIAKIKSKIIYRAKNGQKLIFIQTAVFVMVNQRVKIHFNNISDTCK